MINNEGAENMDKKTIATVSVLGTVGAYLLFLTTKKIISSFTISDIKWYNKIMPYVKTNSKLKGFYNEAFKLAKQLRRVILSRYAVRPVNELLNYNSNLIKVRGLDWWNNKKITELHPKMQNAVRYMLSKAKQDLGNKFNLCIFEAWRDPVRQVFLYGKGRVVPSTKTVTQVLVQSCGGHSFGRAVDIIPLIDGNPSKPTWNEAYYGYINGKLTQHAKAVGVNHPISWDMPHFEMSSSNLCFPEGTEYANKFTALKKRWGV